MWVGIVKPQQRLVMFRANLCRAFLVYKGNWQNKAKDFEGRTGFLNNFLPHE